jgi:hypothetical protein
MLACLNLKYQTEFDGCFMCVHATVHPRSCKWNSKQWCKQKCRFLVQNFNDLMIQQVSYVVNKFNFWCCVHVGELLIYSKKQTDRGFGIKYYSLRCFCTCLFHAAKNYGQLYFRVCKGCH